MENTYMLVRNDNSEVTHISHVVHLVDDGIIIGSNETVCKIPCEGWILPYGVFKIKPKEFWYDKLTCFNCYIKSGGEKKMTSELNSVYESNSTLDIELIHENREKINEIIRILNKIIEAHPDIESDLLYIKGKHGSL